MNILILAAGAPAQNGAYPLCLTEFEGGEPLIERLLGSCAPLCPNQTIVAVPDAEVKQYHLDQIIRLLVPQSEIIPINGTTRGAACTALLAAGMIDNDDELLIINGNELLDMDFAAVVAGFKGRSLDAGVVVFKSVHPRYSYVKLDTAGHVIEAAEKRPISQNATAGFYWYRKGGDFVRAAKNMIRKDACVQGNFYICPVFNELILEQKRIGVHAIESKQYHPLKSERQIDRYEAMVERERTA